MANECKNCKYCVKIVTPKEENAQKYDYYCTYLKTMVAKGFTDNSVIIKPMRCTLSELERKKAPERATQNPIYKPKPTYDRLAWYKIKPTFAWSKLQKGLQFHVPPCMNNKRVDITIVNVFNESFTYTEKGSDFIKVAYKSDILPKIMVEAKVF